MRGQNDTILVGEDEPEARNYLELALRCIGYSVELARDGREVLSCLQTSRSDTSAVLLDLMMPNCDGLETLREIRRTDLDLPVIMISGVTSAPHIVAAMKSGATDFLPKPVSHEDLRDSIARSLERKTVGQPRPRSDAPATGQFFAGRNPKVKEVYDLIQQMCWSEAPVLIQGETGSGKEVVARELHARSPRPNKPFVKLNCAALPSELVESELFGYERGAFTGAFQRKPGIFEMADGGTILLDEIGDMDVCLQAKLLQVLQDHEFQRIGGKETIRVDVRVMAATHRDLETAILHGSFREDLYYRLNVINIQIPPLRERKEDIPGLAEFLMKKHARPGVAAPVISPELKQAMLGYRWPGNVRELENFVRKMIVMQNPDVLARELLARSARIPMGNGLPSAEQQPESPILEQVTRAKEQAEAEAILAALNSTRWNRKRAAALLKIDYKGLLYKMSKLGIGKAACAAGRGFPGMD